MKNILKKIILLCSLMMSFLAIYSCKKDTTKKEKINIYTIDSIKITNAIGERTISLSRSNIAYYFYMDKELKDSELFLIYKNKQYPILKRKCEKLMNGYYCEIEFNDFFVGVDNLNKILDTYNSILNFDRAKLVINKNEYFYLSLKPDTKKILVLDNQIVNPKDSINMNKTIPMIKFISK